MAFGAMNEAVRQREALVKILIPAALILLLIGILLVRAVGGSSSIEPSEPAVPMTAVMIPLQDIQAGEKVNPSMFRLEQRPVSELPQNAVTEQGRVKFATALYPIKANVPFADDALTKRAAPNSLTQSIPPGYRAVTISVDARSAVEGWARPGAKVDVVWITTVNNQRTLKVIVQDAQILSAERRTQIDEQNGGEVAPLPSTVTLLVSKDDSKRIQFASTMGVLSLSLRGEGEGLDKRSQASVNLSDMLGPKSNEVPNAVVKLKTYKGETREYTLQGGKLAPKTEIAPAFSE